MPGYIHYNTFSNHLSGQGCTGCAGNQGSLVFAGERNEFFQVFLRLGDGNCQGHFAVS